MVQRVQCGFCPKKGSMFLNKNRGLAERTMAIPSMFKRETILKAPHGPFKIRDST